jgi:hypothetical protein
LSFNSPATGAHARLNNLLSAVRAQSWFWLAEIQRRLDFTAAIVDEYGVPCALASGENAIVHPQLDAANPAFMAAITNVIRSNQTERLSIDGVAVVCSPLSVGRAVDGVLVLSRDVHSRSADGADKDLEEIASWLARAVQAQLSLPLDDAETFDRVTSLHKLLQEVIERGVESEVISTFAEALIAWDDIEVRGYVQDIRGHFMLAVATPGADRTQVVSIASGLYDELTRLTAAEAHRAGFRQDRDIFMARFGGHDTQPWLLALSGVIRSDDESRLSLYVDLLREAVSRAASIAEARFSGVLFQRLLGATGDVEETGTAALDELKGAIDAEYAGLEVVTSRGTHVLSFGERVAPASDDAVASRDQVVSAITVCDDHTMTLVAQRPRTTPFTRREQQIVDRAATIFSTWLTGVLTRPAAAPVLERRSENREFQQVLDRTANQNLSEGLDVAVVVLLAPAAAPRSGVLQQWVADIRARLRGGDIAGTLSEREVGILLAGANPGDIAKVSVRVCQQALKADSAGVAIGTAARSAGSPVNGSLVTEARQNASQRALTDPQLSAL